jgi:SPP1 gp7 family putative phage head morphogenesis protein
MALEIGGNTPKEALAYWKSRAQVTGAQYKALSDQAKQRAFTVAGLARRDQVETIHTALSKAIEKGETLAQFKKRLGPLMEQQGWTGKRAWRIENIYRTNMQSAYMAGRYAQMKAVAKRRPYWRYVAVKDSRTRPTHAALNGKIYPHDHDFWSAWYPPNGFRCRCTVQTLSAAQVESRGLKVETRVPSMVEPVGPDGVKLPARPLQPDPGFHGNVGREWLSGLSPRELEGELKDLASVAICREGRGLFASSDECKPPLISLAKRHILPVRAADIMARGLAPEKYVKAFLGEFGIADIEGAVVHKLPGDIPVVIDKGFFVDSVTGRFKVLKNNRELYVKLLARTIKEPYEIWMVPGEISGRRVTTLRLLRLFRDGNDNIGGFGVFNLVGGRQWAAATAFTPGMEIRSAERREQVILRYLEKQRLGTLIYREP